MTEARARTSVPTLRVGLPLHFMPDGEERFDEWSQTPSHNLAVVKVGRILRQLFRSRFRLLSFYRSFNKITLDRGQIACYQ